MSPGIPSILIAVVLALPLLSSDAMPAQGKSPEKMELYTAGDNIFPLYKPPGWKVDSRAVENGKVVTVSDPKGGSRAVMRILSMQDRRENSTTLVSRTLKDLRATVSGLDLAGARSTADRGCAGTAFGDTGVAFPEPQGPGTRRRPRQGRANRRVSEAGGRRGNGIALLRQQDRSTMQGSL